MEEIRLIKGKKDEKAFVYLASYCFTDTNNWTSRIFPLLFGDKAWGLFKDSNLASALISKLYHAYIFNALAPVSGISTVESAPQYRNRGYVRKLFNKTLYEDLGNGILFSVLMPFKYKFYEKFGYGYLGGTTYSSFSPDNIKISSPKDGDFILFAENKKHLADMYDVHDLWVRNFTFGIKSRRLPLHKFIDRMKLSKDHLFLCYKNKECKAYIHFHLTNVAKNVLKLEIRRTAWKDIEGFQGLLYFLLSHRDQVKSIEWNMPVNIPLHIICKNPRISQAPRYDYMVRPLDVVKILQRKAEYTPAVEKISFSIEDPVISENNGTYIIEGNKVEKIPYNGENRIPFHLFSSLVVGAFSLKDAEHTGLTDISLPITAYSFFTKNNALYISEAF